MSRLYYDKPKGKGAVGTQSNSTEEYFEKVAKLVPAEIIAAYIAIIGLIPAVNNEKGQLATTIAVFVIGLIGTPVYLYSLADKQKPYKTHLIVSTIAFMVWAYSISGHLIPEIYNSAIASIILIVFSVVSGRIPL